MLVALHSTINLKLNNWLDTLSNDAMGTFDENKLTAGIMKPSDIAIMAKRVNGLAVCIIWSSEFYMTGCNHKH